MSDLFAYVEQAKAAGRTDVALLEFADLIDAGLGGIQPFHRRADLLRALGRVDEARDDYRRAALLEPDNPWPMLWLAQFAFDQDRRWLAAEDIGEAMRRDPDTAEFRVNAAKFYGGLDWLDLAWRVVRDLPDDMDDWWGRERDSAKQRYLTHHADVRAKLRARGKGNVVDADTRLDLARALLKLGRLRAARALSEELMSEAPRSFAAFEVHAWVVARAEGAAAALAFLRAVRFLHAKKESYARALDIMERQVAPSDPEIIPDSPSQSLGR